MARKKRVHASPMRPEIQGALWDAGLYGRLSVLDNGKVDGEPIESQIAIIIQSFLKFKSESLSTTG